MVNAAQVHILRMIGINQFHLYVQQGTSFRSETRRLTTAFQYPIFHQLHLAHRLKFFVASATVYHIYIGLLSTLTTIPFPPLTILRGPPPANFVQRNRLIIFVNRHSRSVVQNTTPSHPSPNHRTTYHRPSNTHCRCVVYRTLLICYGFMCLTWGVRVLVEINS